MTTQPTGDKGLLELIHTKKLHAVVERRTRGMPSYSTRPWAVSGGGVFATRSAAQDFADWLNAFREGRPPSPNEGGGG